MVAATDSLLPTWRALQQVSFLEFTCKDSSLPLVSLLVDTRERSAPRIACTILKRAGSVARRDSCRILALTRIERQTNMFTDLLRKALVAGGLLGVMSFTAYAQTTRSPSRGGPATLGVVVKTKGTVDQTVSGLKKMVADNGMMVMGEIHQGKVLEMTGLRVNSETIFVGNPNIGKQLFSAEPGVGLVVPIRINIYEDEHGQTYVRYIPPSRQLRGFGNAKVDEIAKMLDGKLQNMTAMLPK